VPPLFAITVLRQRDRPQPPQLHGRTQAPPGEASPAARASPQGLRQRRPGPPQPPQRPRPEIRWVSAHISTAFPSTTQSPNTSYSSINQ